MRLRAGARTTMWVGSGAFVGLALGVFLVDPDAGGEYFPFWLFLYLVFGGATLWLGRARDAPAASRPPRASRAAPAAAAKDAPPAPLRLRFSFPDVPDDYPPVLGVGEPVRVRVRVERAGAPAEGAAVRLAGHPRDGARFVAGEGVTGTGGAVEFSIERKQVGELVLEAEASLDESVGNATGSVNLVRYDEEIERLFSEFREYAHEALGPDSRADTARELSDKLREGADAPSAKALLELARVYELVVYGEREADRRLYLALVGALLTLEAASADDEGHPLVAAEG